MKEITLTDIRTIENRFSPIVLRYIVNVNDSVYGLIYNRHARNCHLTRSSSSVKYRQTLKPLKRASRIHHASNSKENT